MPQHIARPDDAERGGMGGNGAVVGVITSLQEQIEWTLRVSSLAVGLLVGLMSLVSMWKKLRKK